MMWWFVLILFSIYLHFLTKPTKLYFELRTAESRSHRVKFKSSRVFKKLLKNGQNLDPAEKTKKTKKKPETRKTKTRKTDHPSPKKEIEKPARWWLVRSLRHRSRSGAPKTEWGERFGVLRKLCFEGQTPLGHKYRVPTKSFLVKGQIDQSTCGPEGPWVLPFWPKVKWPWVKI